VNPDSDKRKKRKNTMNPTDQKAIQAIEKILNIKLKKLDRLDWDSKGYVLNSNKQVIGLSLYDCKIGNLNRILSPLKGLVNLERLYLSNNQISELRSLKDLVNLERLYLSNNQISELSDLKGLVNLTELWLSDNQIKELSPLKGLDKLQYLGRSSNPIESPPPEILKQGVDAIRNYFKQLDAQGSDKIYEAKLMLVGEPGAGKTTLLNKLFDRNFSVPNHSQKSTLGITVKDNWTFVLNETIDFKTNIWDFGGQQIQYMLHQFFLTSDCVYVLMAEKRRELTNFDYWLNIINILGQNSPIILLFNEINIDAVS